MEYELEFAAIQGAAQALLGVKSLGGCIEQCRRENCELTAAECLRFVQGGIGCAEQGFDVLGVFRVDARAGADADYEVAAFEGHGFFEGLDELHAGEPDVLDGARAFIHDREFVTAQAGSEAERASDFGQTGRNGLEDLVAKLVTEAVVHVFEVVDVYEEDADEAVFAGGLCRSRFRAA